MLDVHFRLHNPSFYDYPGPPLPLRQLSTPIRKQLNSAPDSSTVMYLDIKRKTTSSKSQRDQRFSPSKLTVFWIDEWTQNSEPRTPTHQCTVDSCSGWTFNSLNTLKKFKLTFYYQRSSLSLWRNQRKQILNEQSITWTITWTWTFRWTRSSYITMLMHIMHIHS